MCNDDLSQDTGGTYPAGVFIYISSADKMSALLCKLLFTIRDIKSELDVFLRSRKL